MTGRISFSVIFFITVFICYADCVIVVFKLEFSISYYFVLIYRIIFNIISAKLKRNVGTAAFVKPAVDLSRADLLIAAHNAEVPFIFRYFFSVINQFYFYPYILIDTVFSVREIFEAESCF